MGARRGRLTDDPKGIRLEVRLSDSGLKMLDHCVESLSLSKSEIVRRGIERMYKLADMNKQLEEAYPDKQERMNAAKKERENMVYEQAFQDAYEEFYTDRYSELISDPNVLPSEAKYQADNYADNEAKKAATEAVKKFWLK